MWIITKPKVSHLMEIIGEATTSLVCFIYGNCVPWIRLSLVDTKDTEITAYPSGYIGFFGLQKRYVTVN